MKYINFVAFCKNTMRKKPAMLPFVDLYSAEKLWSMQATLVQVLQGRCAILPTGEVVNVVARRGQGQALIKQAVRQGGTHLWHFDVPELRKFYDRCGWVVVGSVPFDRAQSPENWDYTKYGEPELKLRVLPANVRSYSDVCNDD